MTVRDLSLMTNESGKKFLRFSNVEVLGVEGNVNGRDTFFAIVKYSDGSICVWNLPTKDSTCAACSFGDIEYFAMVRAYNKMPEKNILWMYDGYPVRPIWRNDFSDDEKILWHKYEKEILEKYA